MEVMVTCTGTRAIILSTQRGADPTDELVKELAQLTRIPGPKKTDAIHEQIATIQFRLNLPFKEGLGVYLPSANLWNAIREAARGDKKGKDVEKFINPLEIEMPIKANIPKDLESLVSDKSLRDTRLVNHGVGGRTAMVICTRPIIQQWALECPFQIEPEKIKLPDFEKWVHYVGAYIGLGAYRKLYGRFDGKVSKIEAQPLRKAA